ncbi:DUF1996 domain-containing protein [Nonomuraea lactucae]|uniref:DUF1996 domain-containing protein n=1 Tax=Nonomuraea lactucae TaxID=2249762 RepID=UPI000DE3EBA3|nr:DUF1996 domain-containing protein [Nonomuraea lactucae]
MPNHAPSRVLASLLVAAGAVIAVKPLLLPPSATASAAAPQDHGATGSPHGPHTPTPQATPPVKQTPSATPKASDPAKSDPPPRAQYREFAANCTVTHRLSDDPIVYPGRAGAAHNHTFFGNRETNARSTNQSLLGGPTSCQDKKDGTGYWIPTLLQDGKPVDPQMVTTYYKSGVNDYRTVKPFPPGFRLIVGDMHTPSAAQFQGYWSCGSRTSADIPASCPPGSALIVRLKAPSCWDGVNLDSANHKSHMAFPVRGVCPPSHPVPLPMLEMKVPYKLPGGVTRGLRYSSGAGYSFHYDFMNGWDQARQAALVKHCVNGGRQCNGVGYDQHKP